MSAPIRGQALRRALVGLPLDEAPSVAAAALGRGKRLFATLKRPEAAEALARAISLYDNHVAWKRARGPLVEASTYLLLCHHALGQKVAARRVAARLRELTGNQVPKGVPADVWAAYPLVPLPLTPRRILTVKAPPKARVYLDDQLAGRGPQKLPVGPGAHRIRVELAGHRVFVRQVAAAATAEAVLVSLVRRATDAFGDIRAELAKVRRAGKHWDPAPIKRLAQQLRIDHLLVCVVVGSSLKARWFSARLGKFAGAWLWLPLGGTQKLLQPVQAAFAGVHGAERKRARALAETDTKPKKKSSPKLWKKWYFWVAAALVAGVVAAFAIKDSLTEEKVILRVTRP